MENYTILLYIAVGLTLVLLVLLQIIHCVVKIVNYTLSNFSVIGNTVLGNLSVLGNLILSSLIVTIGLIFQIAKTVITIYQSFCVLVRQYNRSQNRTRYLHILYQEEWHGWWDLENLTLMRPPGR